MKAGNDCATAVVWEADGMSSVIDIGFSLGFQRVLPGLLGLNKLRLVDAAAGDFKSDSVSWILGFSTIHQMTFSMNAAPTGNIEKTIDADRLTVYKPQLIISRLSSVGTWPGLDAGACFLRLM
jgi:hypothetical protein